MKRFSIMLLACASLALTTSCNDYLDKLPDDRAEVNNLTKAANLLVSAYPAQSPDLLMEYSTDNVLDNGKLYYYRENQDKAYRWEEVTTTGNDDPRSVWNSGYAAVGTANEVLAALGKLEDTPEAKAIRSEALLCRAFAIFRLSNMFCMAYDPTKANEYLGLPYPKEAGVTVNERGTLKELYDNINADIEEALPYVSDAHLKTPKYHFNFAAAYAFAARFNLFYHNYDKAIEYANKALGPNPVLRDMVAVSTMGAVDYGNAYVRASEPANLMFVIAYSLAGRAPSSSSYSRFNYGRPVVTSELWWAVMPWGSGSTNNTLWESHKLYGNDQMIRYPRMAEFFEVTDKVNNTGYPHIIDVVFTTDETVLVRAEAYALKNNVAGALADINTWVTAHCEAKRGTATRPVMTEESLNTFYNGLANVPAVIENAKDRGVKKPLHPQGFTVAEGTQTNLIHMILQMRRLETCNTGQRFMDIKRYGIEFSHNLDGEETLKFKAGDLRGAMQLPTDVVTAGLEANPRETTNK